MLVITRKNGQKIMINDNIEITIVEAKNGVCKVAIKADRMLRFIVKRFICKLSSQT